MALRSFFNRTLYHVDMCSGSGMLGLGLKCALGERLRTVAYVEHEARAAALLVERMEEAALDMAPLWDDVTDCTNPLFTDYVRQFDPLLVSAGYPCQPWSCSGKRRGVNDERHIWPFINDFIRLAKPRFVFLENVHGHLSLGFDGVVGDLLQNGYDITCGLFPAAEVGASHERKRLFALAALGDATMPDVDLPDAAGLTGDTTPHDGTPGKSGEILADAGRPRRQRGERTEPPGQRHGPETHGSAREFRSLLFAPGPDAIEQWHRVLRECPALEPTVRGMADGLASWVRADELRMLGNGVVSLAAAYAFTLLAAAHDAHRNASSGTNTF